MKYLKLTAVAGVVSLALVGCGGDSSSPAATTPVTLSVTDAPVDEVKEVVVTFGTVALLPQGGGSPLIYDVYLTDDEGNPVDENGDPIPDGEDPVPLSINLLDYQGSKVMPLIKDEVVTVGNYKLCVFANDGDHPTHPSYVIEDDDTERELSVKGNGACPQGVGKIDNTGVLYFNDSFAVNPQNNDFAVEFDLRRGLKNTSTFPDYSIQRTSVTLINTAVTGNIEGTVATATFNACNDPADTNVAQAVYLYETGTTQENMAPIGGTDTVKPLTSATVSYNETQQFYEFSFGFLDPGNYNLGYTCTAQHDDGEESSDPVAAGFNIYSVQSDLAVVGNQDTSAGF